MTIDLEGLPGLETLAPAAGYVFRPWSELLNRPRKRWLVEGVFPAGGIVWLFGDPGSGKSFVAFDVAVAVACGAEDWHGYPIPASGPVRLLLGEGHFGAPERIGAAILSRHVADMDAVDVAILEAPPNLLDPAAMQRLSEQLQADDPRPVLIVVDTWNSCAHGAEGAHSDTASVATACASLAALARDTGATVLILDHPNKTEKGSPAGNFAKSAASDAMWSVTADKDTSHTVLKCVKLKDAPIDKRELRFERVPLRKGDEDSPAYIRTPEDLVSLDDLQRADSLTLKALVEIATGEGATDTEWKLVSLGDGVSRPGYYRAKKRLLEGNLVQHNGNRFQPTAGGRMLVSPSLTKVSLCA